MSIPRKIYHIWLSDQPENDLQRRCTDSWKMLGWEIENITLENCPKTSPFVQKALAMNSRIGWTKANDFLRIQLLYERGGVYLDNDCEIIRPQGFEKFLDEPCFMGAEDGEVVNQAVIGSEKGNHLLKMWMETCEMHDPANPESPVFTLQIMTDILKALGWSGNAEFSHHNVRVLPSDYFYPSHWKSQDKIEITKNTVAIHHWLKSWGDK
jgi:mannosyltransferase OCH1-like enzyme